MKNFYKLEKGQNLHSILNRILRLIDARLPINLKKFPRTLRSVTIMLTGNCNSKCKSCNFWKKQIPWAEHLSVNQWQSVMKLLSEIGIKQIRITGGEPFLYEGIFDICKEAFSYGISSIGIQTNGLLMAKYRHEINNSPISSLHISLDGIDEINDNLRGIKGHYKLVLDSIKGLNKQIFITTTPYRENIDCLEKLIHICKSRNFNIEFNLPSKSLFYLHNSIVNFPTPQQTDYFINLLKKYKSDIKINDSTLRFMNVYLKTQKINYKSCILGFKKIYIGYSGDVYSGCYPMGQIGNLQKKSIQEIINSDFYTKRLHSMLKLKCPGCVCGYNSNPKL